MNMLKAVMIATLLAALSIPASALDFGKFGDALKKLDVEKALDVGKRVVQGTQMLPEDQEIALGADLSARLLGAMPPLEDPETQAFVNRLGLWIALQTERPGLPWQFVVTNEDSVGAFAVPGGTVFVTAGLLQLMQTEHELAGVLAHEIHHVVERHHLKAIMKQARLDLAKELASNVAESYVGNPKVSEAMLNAGVNLYAAGLDQEDEFDADKRGTRTAAASGYDATGLLLVLSTLDSIDTNEPSLSLTLSTHPPTRERIDRLAPMLESLLVELPPTLSDENRFQSIRARLQSQAQQSRATN